MTYRNRQGAATVRRSKQQLLSAVGGLRVWPLRS
jgi:hypothetical protein